MSARALPASSECPICGVDTPHRHTVIEKALYQSIEPVAESLCAAFGYSWRNMEDEWPWPTGRRFLCRDFFRWQARFALGLDRPRDHYDEPTRNGLQAHNGDWPLTAFEALRNSLTQEPQ